MKAILNGAFGRIELEGTKITIGRASTNTIVLNSSQVSAYHAEIQQQGNGYTIIDSGSANGTFFNDYRLPPHVAHPLNGPARLRFGQDPTDPLTLFTYELLEGVMVEPTMAAHATLPAYSASPQYRSEPRLAPPPPPPYLSTRQAKAKKESDQEGKWSWKDWLVKVIIPILTILATAGFFTARAVTPTLPQLHLTYAGHITTVSGTASLLITGVHENSAGDFTATGTDPCPLTLENGIVSTDNSVSFELKETPVAGTACGALGEYQGTVQSNGSMSGTWNVPNSQIQGSWDLS